MNHSAPADQPFDSRSGLALFGVLTLLGTLGLVSAVVYSIVSTNIQIGGNYWRQQESFAGADAGVEYVQARLNADLQNGTVSLGSSQVAVNYAAPTGYSFDTVTNLTQLANPRWYVLQVTGRSGAARTTLEAVLAQKNALGDMGVFGDDSVDLQPGFAVYSYDSRINTDPDPSTSTGQAGVGSNRLVDAQHATIDGTVMLGEDAFGVTAQCNPTSMTSTEVGRVSPDPLGIVGGLLALSMAHYSQPANNDNAAANIVNNEISLGSHGEFSLPSGYFYLVSFSLGPHSTLTIDSTPNDPAVIFLDGTFRAQPGTTIDNVSQSPRAFYVFSSSSDTFRVQPNGAFRGVVYAPLAELRIQPMGAIHGILWGHTVRMQPNGAMYVDMAALDDFASGSMELVHWKEIR